jgi:hypothetical protein
MHGVATKAAKATSKEDIALFIVASLVRGLEGSMSREVAAAVVQ